MASNVKRTVQLYAAITASGDALASITIPQNATLTGMLISTLLTGAPTDGDSVRLEISTNSARQDTTNDATGILGLAGVAYDVTTSGASDIGVNLYVPVNGKCKAGDKIYLHATEVGSGTWATRVLLYFA